MLNEDKYLKSRQALTLQILLALQFYIIKQNMKKLGVVAFGGNALILGKQKGTIDEQEENAYKTCERLLVLINGGYDLVITHGNGPQVGNIMLANAAGDKMYGVPEMPLDISVAYSQGFIGYVIEQQLRNVLRENDIDRDIITIITQVLVNKDDPAFEDRLSLSVPFIQKKKPIE